MALGILLSYFFTLHLAVTKNPWVMEKNYLHIWIQR